MSTIPTNRESDRFMLRLPDGMRDRIKAAAEENNRSMNAEIVARLEQTFSDKVDDPFSAFQRERDRVVERLEEIQQMLRDAVATGAIVPDDK